MATTAPNSVERTLAGALAADHWSQHPTPARDTWIATAIPRLYAERYARDRLPARSARTWATLADRALADVPDRPVLPWAWYQGPGMAVVADRLLGSALAARIGEGTLQRGLSAAVASDRHDLGGLVAALEEASGRDLAGWFEAWAVAGIRPRVRGTCRLEEEGDVVVVRLDASPPVGRYELPLVVGKDDDERRVHWIEITEGSGTLRLPLDGEAAASSLRLDPDRWFPLRKRALDCGDVRRAAGARAR